MDKINFTGYRNVGALKLEFNHPTLSNFRRMMIELTDDGIADLTEFRKDLKRFRRQRQDNFLQLDLYELKECNPATRSNHFIVVNGNPIEIKPKNIPLLKHIADLQADIATAEDEKFRASSRYINSEECVRNFTQNDAIDFNITNDINYKNLHSPRNIRENGEIFCVAYSSYADNILRICG